MKGIFYNGRWYENMDMVCGRCGNLVYKSDNPGYRFQCFRCDEDLYSFEAAEQDGLHLSKVSAARPSMALFIMKGWNFYCFVEMAEDG